MPCSALVTSFVCPLQNLCLPLQAAGSSLALWKLDALNTLCNASKNFGCTGFRKKKKRHALCQMQGCIISDNPKSMQWHSVPVAAHRLKGPHCNTRKLVLQMQAFETVFRLLVMSAPSCSVATGFTSSSMLQLVSSTTAHFKAYQMTQQHRMKVRLCNCNVMLNLNICLTRSLHCGSPVGHGLCCSCTAAMLRACICLLMR